MSAPRRPSAKRSERVAAEWYHLEIRGESASDRFRECLSVVQSQVATGDCDIPWAEADDWPPEVRAAAEVLKASFVPSGYQDSYQRTRLIDFSDKADATGREALITFAPYAYDTSFHGCKGRQLVELSDFGASCAFRLLPDEVDRVVALIGAERVQILRRRR